MPSKSENRAQKNRLIDAGFFVQFKPALSAHLTHADAIYPPSATSVIPVVLDSDAK